MVFSSKKLFKTKRIESPIFFFQKLNLIYPKRFLIEFTEYVECNMKKQVKNRQFRILIIIIIIMNILHWIRVDVFMSPLFLVDQLYRQADQSHRGGRIPEGLPAAVAHAKLVLQKPEDSGEFGAEQLVRTR